VIIGHDKRLLLFTLGGMLSAVAYDSFSAYLAQYMSIVYPHSSMSYHLIASLVTTNAIVVISLQYFISKWLRERNLLRWIVVGTSLFIIGQLGFALAKSNIVWHIAMVIFTLGEIIIIPAEYLFIDLIAPEGLKGSYFGMQNIARLGGAFGPIICGFVLNFSPNPSLVFYIFILFILAGTIFYYLGNRA
jgi:MFS family permease